ncbi:MAG: hypothetical protein MI919_04760, partial [Holophagales bacterium]|nr:hypothetical protein [Holophagales bacterium]
ENGTGTPKWAEWSSTSSYLNLVSEWAAAGGDPSQFPKFGATYYPQACLDYCQTQGIECSDYRTISQVGKINDSVFEANSAGLSSNPVIAANGTYLRYEILINRDMYDFVSREELYDVDNLVTGNVSAPFGVTNLKLAWMDVTGVTAADYYTEELLVFTSADSSSTGQDSCELVDMGLVGMHIAHKTPSQPSLVWSTFEQVSNAPDCGAFTAETQVVNTSCPSTVATSWNFYSSECQADTTSGMCASCNTPPSSNQPSGVSCTGGFCVDLPPADTSGYSRLCRQVPVTADGPYSDSFAWNSACQAALGTSVWANYMLISTQWLDWAAPGAPPEPSGPSTVAPELKSILKRNYATAKVRTFLRPQVPDNGSPSQASGAVPPGQPVPPPPPDWTKDNPDKPFLANTSMESYERANCTGCHGKAALTNESYPGQKATDCPLPLPPTSVAAVSAGSGQLPPQGCPNYTGTDHLLTQPSDYYFTDFSWWLALEVPADGVE